MEGLFLQEQRQDVRDYKGLTREVWLGRIFQWDPKWLNEDKYDCLPPPIVGINELNSTMLSYETYDDYYKIMIGLLTHEFWYLLKNEFNDNSSMKKKIKGTVNSNSFEYLSCEDNSKCTIFYFDLKVNTNLTKLEEKSYPLRGDLVHFHHPNNPAELFGYVEQIARRQLENERVELTYTLATKPVVMKSSSCTLELRTVISMSSHLVLINSLQFLPYSQLEKSVLRPTVEEYELAPLDSTNFPPFLLTEDDLNSTQLQAIARIKTTIEEGVPKISLIQGPPGTGKSQVIVNTVASLIIAKSARRILVCAHSNQAIDEVVLRLLEIQKIFYANGLSFNVVRVGQEDKMHENVKKISSSTLALESITNSGVNVTSEKQFEKEQQILEEADIIASTLMSCCTNQMTNIFGPNKLPIPVCLIDEAAQATELATVAPLMLGTTNLILIGDTKQLRPTVVSMKAAELGLDVSLFSRAEKIFNSNQSTNPIMMLNIQYRMVDAIALWPNRYFYRGALRNGSIVQPLCLPHYKLFNHLSPQDNGNYSNVGEADLVVNIVYTIMTRSNLDNFHNEVKLGIITPYKKQRQLIMRLMRTHLSNVPEQILNKIRVTDVNTVDSFQGSERDIVIMSCVRSEGIGFVSDPHRLCVSLTRARHSLIICGNFNTFNQNAMWRSLLNDAKSRGVYVNIGHDADANELEKHLIVQTSMDRN